MANTAPAKDANTEATPAEPTTDAAGPVEVKYIGGHNLRSISSEEFKSVNVQQASDLVWSPENDFTVPVSDVNKNTLEYLRSQSDEFLVK